MRVMNEIGGKNYWSPRAPPATPVEPCGFNGFNDFSRQEPVSIPVWAATRGLVAGYRHVDAECELAAPRSAAMVPYQYARIT
jgi:hypothetical protein